MGEVERIEEREEKRGKRWGLVLFFWLGVFLSGIAAAALAAWLNGIRFGLYTWPLIACVDMFTFTTAGFFCTDEKAELLYGTCSIASAVCAIVQLAILF